MLSEHILRSSSFQIISFWGNLFTSVAVYDNDVILRAFLFLLAVYYGTGFIPLLMIERLSRHVEEKNLYDQLFNFRTKRWANFGSMRTEVRSGKRITGTRGHGVCSPSKNLKQSPGLKNMPGN